MMIPFILALINAMIILQLNSSLSLKTHQYENKITDTKIENIIYQDDILIEATDSYCRKNIELCYQELKENNKVEMTNSRLDGYTPDNIVYDKVGMNFYDSIKIDYTNKEIVIIHKINDIKKRKEYVNFYLNKNIKCGDGSELPCLTEEIIKNKKISYELEIKIKNKIIEELNERLSIQETYAGEYTEIENKIDTLNQEIDILITNIKQRKKQSY